jgi:hypothetical protein
MLIQYILTSPIFLWLEQVLNFFWDSWGMLNNRPLWFNIVNYLKSTNSREMIVRSSLDDLWIPWIGLKQYILTLPTLLRPEQAWAFLGRLCVFLLYNRPLWFIVVNCLKPTNSHNMIVWLSLDDLQIPCIGLKQYIWTLPTLLRLK